MFSQNKNQDESLHNIHSLARGVLELCTLCETVMLAAHDLHESELPPALIERLEAVRASALPIYQDTVETVNNPYSLSALDQWVWRE